MQMLKHWDVQKPLDWGKAPVVSQLNRGANHTLNQYSTAACERVLFIF